MFSVYAGTKVGLDEFLVKLDSKWFEFVVLIGLMMFGMDRRVDCVVS